MPEPKALNDATLEAGDIQQLRQALQEYSRANEAGELIETVRSLYQQQGEAAPNGSGDKKPLHRLKREELKLICYEYVYA